VQQLLALIELGEVHVAEAQVVEEIGIIGILAEELLQADADLQGGHGPALRAGLGHILMRLHWRWQARLIETGPMASRAMDLQVAKDILDFKSPIY